MDIKHKTCDIRTWKKELFLDISSNNIVPSLYQCVCHLTVVSATFIPPFQPLSHQQNVCHQRWYLADETEVTRLTRDHVQAVRRMFKKSLLGCLCCMGSGIVMMKQYPSCQLAWIFSELHPDASTELHSTMQNSHLHLPS
jgi:uncharacterized protein (DUF2225 family)